MKARNTLHTEKFNAPAAIPLAEDVQKLYSFLKERIKEKVEELNEDRSSATLWYDLCRLSAAYVLLFNRRRPGELSRLTLETFQKKMKGIQNDDIQQSLSQSERLLASSLEMVEIRGKRGKKVPVLFNKISMEAINCLLKHRAKCSVKNDNKFVFAIPGCDTPVRITDGMREFAKRCGAKEPSLLTATYLRKHVATSCQLLGGERTRPYATLFLFTY